MWAVPWRHSFHLSGGMSISNWLLGIWDGVILVFQGFSAPFAWRTLSKTTATTSFPASTGSTKTASSPGFKRFSYLDLYLTYSSGFLNPFIFSVKVCCHPCHSATQSLRSQFQLFSSAELIGMKWHGLVTPWRTLPNEGTGSAPLITAENFHQVPLQKLELEKPF